MIKTHILTLLIAGILFASPVAFAQTATADAPTKVENSDSAKETPKKVGKNKKKQGDDFQYVRVVRDKEAKKGSLDTAVRKFVGENGVCVDLVGAIHIGEKSYYKELNKLFEDYDVVLYEIVAEEGTRPEPSKEDKAPGSVIGFAQYQFANLLGLVHQLEHIDYTKENMVHADLSPKEFAEAQKARDDGFAALYFREMGFNMARKSKASDSDDSKVIMAFFKKDRKRALKDALADQFSTMDSEQAMKGTSDGTSIITDRNNRVLEKLKGILDEGSKKKIAIFYGAAHLPEFSEKLKSDFNMKPQDDQTIWIKAWKF
ncbi:MAG: hypothetical protein IJQ39_08045 [Thermoguttaceae bacterium]|nr:hypothetical protein [Thermoguttaceae bacterium]